MIEAADSCIVVVHPDDATEATAGMLLLVPRSAAGRRVDKVWDTLGMRATRSDSLILEDCWVPEAALLLQMADIGPVQQPGATWLWGSYTAVYLGVGVAAHKDVVKVVPQ